MSFSNNLERVHFFDPNETFRPGRGASVDFRVNISNARKAGGRMNSASNSQRGKNSKVEPYAQYEQYLLDQAKAVREKAAKELIAGKNQSKRNSAVGGGS